jgi:hypothetical protein
MGQHSLTRNTKIARTGWTIHCMRESTKSIVARRCGDSERNRITLTQGGQTTSFAMSPVGSLSQLLVRTRPDGSMTYYVYGLPQAAKYFPIQTFVPQLVMEAFNVSVKRSATGLGSHSYHNYESYDNYERRRYIFSGSSSPHSKGARHRGQPGPGACVQGTVGDHLDGA